METKPTKNSSNPLSDMTNPDNVIKMKTDILKTISPKMLENKMTVSLMKKAFEVVTKVSPGRSSRLKFYFRRRRFIEAAMHRTTTFEFYSIQVQIARNTCQNRLRNDPLPGANAFPAPLRNSRRQNISIPEPSFTRWYGKPC
jgi:hypothetical protein